MRDGKSEIGPEHWHVIGGMFDTDYSFFDSRNIEQDFYELIEKNIAKEFVEECNTTEVDFTLTGLVMNRFITVDFTHIAKIKGTSQ